MTTAVPPAAPTRPDDEEPTAMVVRGDGVDLCAFTWEGGGPPVLLAHATGFHARTWDAVARRLPGRHVVALDLRGHGRSEKPAEPYTWDRFGADVAAVIDALDLQRVTGVGHSMGGHSLVDAARRDVTRFGALLLVDPTISRPQPGGRAPGGMAEAVARRRNTWTSPEEFVERFRDRFPYSAWEPEVLRDQAEYGLLPDPAGGGGLVLACPPAVEGEIYGHGPTDLYDAIPALDLPVRVLRAREPEPGVEAPTFFNSPTDPGLAAVFPQGEDVLLADRSHFIPMEDPALVARHIVEVAARVG
jgi:pimeloyl-ACP methyl ester carboxylesterase